MTERFRPGGVTHALVSGLLEAALASVLLGCSLLAADSSPGAATSLSVAALLWAVLAVYSLAVALLRARVFAAEVSRGRTRLVARDGRVRKVRGVRGAAQGNRFRARVLARATEAAVGADRLGQDPKGPEGG